MLVSSIFDLDIWGVLATHNLVLISWFVLLRSFGSSDEQIVFD